MFVFCESPPVEREASGNFSKGVSENICGSNPNVETRNPKWFDRLTILSDVEGQIKML
jgi:hypothetical protein